MKQMCITDTTIYIIHFLSSMFSYRFNYLILKSITLFFTQNVKMVYILKYFYNCQKNNEYVANFRI